VEKRPIQGFLLGQTPKRVETLPSIHIHDGPIRCANNAGISLTPRGNLYGFVMLEVRGNIWTYPADYICITTNGDINKRGEAVMGRGVAYQAAKKHEWMAQYVAYSIKHYGNVVNRIAGIYFLFPVKHHWHEQASLDLIRESTRQLKLYAEMEPDKIFVLPKPGCGNGQLQWHQVKPIVETLPDNIHVIDL